MPDTNEKVAALDALRELVALKELKERIEAMPHIKQRFIGQATNDREDLIWEYERRKEPAWQAARAALRGIENPKGRQGSESPVANPTSVRRDDAPPPASPAGLEQVREACAKVCENLFPPIHAHASENSDRYRIQDETARLAAKRIRALPLPPLDTQWVSVPREPTDAMIQAMEQRMVEGAKLLAPSSIVYALWQEVYRAMLRAAALPAAPRGEDETR